VRTGRYTVIAADGRVLAEENRHMDNHRDRPEIMAAANTGMGPRASAARCPRSDAPPPGDEEGLLSGFVRTSAPGGDRTWRAACAGYAGPCSRLASLGSAANSFTRLLDMTDAARGGGAITPAAAHRPFDDRVLARPQQ
jgi:hypothetical protein